MSGPEASREQVYASWLAWVGENLGNNPRLAALAAGAATEAAAQGAAFIGASDAARSAWNEAAGGATAARSTGWPPQTIVVAMGMAIGGSAVSSAFSLWFVRLPDGYGSWALGFAIYNLSLLALNAWFLYEMWQGARWAWQAAYALIVVGAIFDFVSVFPPLLYVVDFAAIYLAAVVAPHAEWLANLALVWLWIHLIVIQVPLLVLLRAAPSHRWFGTGSPAPANP